MFKNVLFFTDLCHFYTLFYSAFFTQTTQTDTFFPSLGKITLDKPPALWYNKTGTQKTKRRKRTIAPARIRSHFNDLKC